MSANAATISLAELDSVRVYGLPMRNRFRGITRRQGVLLGGPSGWGEFCPFEDYDDEHAVPWLAAALESVAGDWPEPVRDRVPVNCTVPAVDADTARSIVAASGCRTAKVKVAEPSQFASDDVERVAAVRDALGPSGAIRVDANAAWDVDTAVARIAELDRAAGGLEYVEQPCPTVEELAEVRAAVAEAGPGSPVLETSGGQVDPEFLFDRVEHPVPVGAQLSFADLLEQDACREHAHSAYRSVEFTAEGAVDPRALMAFLDDRPAGLYRAKGTVHFGIPGHRQRFLLQTVGNFVRFHRSAWPAGERRATSLVLIGTGLDAEDLRARLTACLADDPESADEYAMLGVLKYTE